MLLIESLIPVCHRQCMENVKKKNLLSDCRLGDWKESLLDSVTEIIISPGIAETEAIVVWARLQKIPVISDIELFGRYAKASIIGITGSNGKSTVTQLLGEMAIGSGKNTVICGNIGKPVMESLSDEAELYVVELSSYQLDYTNNLNLLTGVVTNITPDHLDRYPNYDVYIASKLNLYQYCQYSVINLDESLVQGIKGDSCYAIEGLLRVVTLMPRRMMVFIKSTRQRYPNDE